MGFFTKPAGAVATGSNSPVTRERIAAILEAADWNIGVDGDGDVFGTWDGHLFYFFLLGERDEILQVRGRWAGDAPAGAQAELQIWPEMIHVFQQFPAELPEALQAIEAGGQFLAAQFDAASTRERHP